MKNITSENIINKEQYNLIEKHIICPLCKSIYINPVQCTKCQFTCCETCSKNLSFKKNIRTCKNNCYKSQIIDCRLIKLLLNVLKISCPNKCGEAINYDQYQNHMLFSCEKIDYERKHQYLKKEFEEITQQLYEYNGLGFGFDSSSSSFNSREHIHPLCPIEFVQGEKGWKCRICLNDKPKGKTCYFCSLCEFYLCEECKKKEEKELKK